MLSAASVEEEEEEEEAAGATVEEVGAEVGAGAGVEVGASSHDSAEGVPKVGLGLQMREPGRLYTFPKGCTPQVQRHLPSPPLAEQDSSVLDFSQAPKLVPS
jgi:hypothetical protein